MMSDQMTNWLKCDSAHSIVLQKMGVEIEATAQIEQGEGTQQLVVFSTGSTIDEALGKMRAALYNRKVR